MECRCDVLKIEGYADTPISTLSFSNEAGKILAQKHKMITQGVRQMAMN